MKISIVDPIKTFEFHNGTMLEHLGKKHEVWYAGSIVSQTDILQRMNRDDLVWIECCDTWFREAMRHPKLAKVICRIHSYEIFTGYPSNCNWENCDKLLFVSSELETLTKKIHSNATFPSTVIFPNGVDYKTFQWKEKQYGNKIAYVGWINYKKNPQMLVYLAAAIRAVGLPHVIHVAGLSQDLRYDLYLHDMISKCELKDRIIFDGWIPNQELPDYFDDKSYIINTSLYESFCNSVVEGMACGLLPLVHAFYGASSRFGRDCVFTDVGNFVNLLKVYEVMSNKQKVELSKEKLRMVKQWDINKMLLKLDEIIEEVAGDVNEPSK